MKKIIRIFAILTLLILIYGCKPIPPPPELLTEEKTLPPLESQPDLPEIKDEQPQSKLSSDSLWKLGKLVIAGKYADAEIIDIENGKYRMYYAAEPEVAGFKGQVYSAVSNDGITWTPETGERMEWATFPSIIKMPDGKYRMYYQKGGLIKSALSSEGLSWKEEAGTRIDTVNNVGLNLENVAAPTILKNGQEYLMVYRGTINEKYPEKVPNANTQLFLWATSQDGLIFEKKGLALDSRTDEFKGLLDGPEFVIWDDGTIRLYFWSYQGIYHTIFSNEKFSVPEFDYTTNTDAIKQFPENPPCDPTISKINGKWHLYYGQHTQGIFYATLEN